METNIIHNDFPELKGTESNFYNYRKTALRWIQTLSGKEWTDYNAHDPGITILEALCYTLTEIEYKLDFSMEEILVTSSARTPFKLKDNAFYLAENILTSAPVTIKDYRKLIIDTIKEINNAWIIPKQEPGNKNKSYEVLLLKKKQVKLPETAIRATQKLLKQYKGYGSKIMPVKVAEFEYISLSADIYIEHDENAEAVLANMFFNLNEAILNVNPDRQTVSELEEQGMGYDEIFDGPRMDNGVITGKNLSDNIDTISLVKVKKIIAATEGISMVSGLSMRHKLNGADTIDTKISFPIEKDGKYLVPFFSPKPKLIKNRICVYKNQKKIEVNTFKISEIIDRVARKTKRDYVIKTQNESLTYTLNAQNRNIQDYYSIKNDFPTVYGLKKKGFALIQNLKAEDSDQLKAYLLPFEQVLANAFMRLAHVSKLFSIYHLHKAFLHQAVLSTDFRSESSQYTNPDSQIRGRTKRIEKRFRNELSDLIHRNKYLTHLLARFDVYIQDSFEMHIADDQKDHLKQMIISKEKMLQQVEKITANRSIYDYHNTDGMSSLEKELYLRLAINEPPQKPLNKAFSELEYTFGEVHETHLKKFDIKEFDYLYYEPYSIERIQNFNYKKQSFGFHTSHEKVLETFLKTGISKASYKLIKSVRKNKYYVVLSNPNGNSEILISIEKSREAAVKQVTKLVKKFRALNKASEGFYLIDHSLLETKSKKAYGNVTIDEDFTRFRMSFVFPAWTARFQDFSFQKQTERIVAKLVPAHVRANCIWLDLEEMIPFETMYSRWYKAFAGTLETSELPEHSEALIAFLKENEQN